MSQPDQTESLPSCVHASGSKPRLSLFRNEVLQSRSLMLDSGVTITHTRSITTFVVCVGVLAALLSLILALGTMSRKVRVTGIVVHDKGSITVSSPIQGTITKIHVHDGQPVAPGALMFEISGDRNIEVGSAGNASKQRAEERQLALEAELSSIRAGGARRMEEIATRLKGARKEILSVDEEVEVTDRRLLIAEQRAQRALSLKDKGFYSLPQTEEEELKILEVKARLNGLKRTKQQLETYCNSLEAERLVAEENLRTLVAQIDGRRASLRQESVETDSRHSIRIVAVTDGIATNIAYQIGQQINPGQVIATVTPVNATYEVHLYAPSRAVGHLRPGQLVSVRYHAFPFQQYGRHTGVIREIGSTPFAPNEIPTSIASTVMGNAQSSGDARAVPEGLYRVKVSFDQSFRSSDGALLNLRQGMTLDADISGRSATIWRWMVAPLNVAY